VRVEVQVERDVTNCFSETFDKRREGDLVWARFIIGEEDLSPLFEEAADGNPAKVPPPAINLTEK